MSLPFCPLLSPPQCCCLTHDERGSILLASQSLVSVGGLSPSVSLLSKLIEASTRAKWPHLAEKAFTQWRSSSAPPQSSRGGRTGGGVDASMQGVYDDDDDNAVVVKRDIRYPSPPECPLTPCCQKGVPPSPSPYNSRSDARNCGDGGPWMGSIRGGSYHRSAGRGGGASRLATSFA
jgi:hypothetical protein